MQRVHIISLLLGLLIIAACGRDENAAPAVPQDRGTRPPGAKVEEPVVHDAAITGEASNDIVSHGKPLRRHRIDEQRYLGNPLHLRNLTVWPVLATTVKEVDKFLTLKEAQSLNVVTIREAGTVELDGEQLRERAEALRRAVAEVRSGRTVGELIETLPSFSLIGTLEIDNRGKYPILVPSGTVVKGGNQDRQIGEDTIVPPLTQVQVKAYCVEQGRWSGLRDGKSTAGTFESVEAVAATPVRYSAQYAENQARVWSAISGLHAMSGAKVPATGTYLCLVEHATQDVASERGSMAEAIREHFERQSGSVVGFAYAIDGRPTSARTFAHPYLLTQHLNSFLHAICTEAILAQREARRANKPIHEAPASAEDMVSMVKTISIKKEVARTTLAGNRIGLRSAPLGNNANCYALDVASGKEILLMQDWTKAMQNPKTERVER